METSSVQKLARRRSYRAARIAARAYQTDSQNRFDTKYDTYLRSRLINRHGLDSSAQAALPKVQQKLESSSLHCRIPEIKR
jgi:hypothetical protein